MHALLFFIIKLGLAKHTIVLQHSSNLRTIMATCYNTLDIMDIATIYYLHYLLLSQCVAICHMIYEPFYIKCGRYSFLLLFGVVVPFKNK